MRYDHLGKEFNRTFSHHTAEVNDLKIHYVTGGRGKPMVLLHGYPQTWYAFRKIMPELAQHYTLIVPDLRGLGDSDKSAGAYDTASVADDVRSLVKMLGYPSVYLLGHDFGANVAYAYAANFNSEVERLVLLDVGMLSNALAASPMLPRVGKSLWWFQFHMVPELPELLVAGREEIYLEWFYKQNTFIKTAIEPEDIKEYVRCYAADGGMKAGFDYYRALFNDLDFNAEKSLIPLHMPALAIGGEKSFGKFPYESWKHAFSNMEGAVIANSGHYIPEEQPAELVRQLKNFFI